MSTRQKCLHLYWVTTRDHDEDWFIVAANSRSAQRFHERYEGYNPGDAAAELVLQDIDLHLRKGETPPFHAQIEHLQAVGCVTLHTAPGQRAVLCEQRYFVEGSMEAIISIATDNAAEASGLGRPRGTTRPKRAD